MRRWGWVLLVLVPGLVCVRFGTVRAEDQCIACHAELDDELAAPVEHFKTDVHAHAAF